MATSQSVQTEAMSGNGVNIGNNLIVIHRVITRGLQVAISSCQTYVQNGFPNDSIRSGFMLYVQALVTVLHGHHTGEDSIAIPCLRLKIAGAPYDQLLADHRAMEAPLATIDSALAGMRDGSNAPLAKLQDALGELQTVWTPHIGKEEDHFSCQILAAALSPKEHKDLEKDLAEHGQANSNPPFLTLPFMIYNVRGEDREFMIAHFPAELTQHLVPVVWKEKWAPMQPFLMD